MRTYTLLLLMIIAACSGSAQWKKYSDEKGRFATAFKGATVVKQEAQAYAFGDVTWTTVSSAGPDDNNLAYSVSYGDFPAGFITSDSLGELQGFFIFLQSDLAATLGDDGLNNLNIKTVQQYPGREFRWLDRKNRLGYTRRVFLVGTRAYRLEVRYKLEQDFNLDIQGFLGKFTLLDTKENPNPEPTALKPEKKFTAAFPGPTQTRANPVYHEAFGQIYAVMEGYEVPKDRQDLPSTLNIMYAVNYARLPAEKLREMSPADVQQFVIHAFTDNILAKPGGKVLMQKEISLDGHWGMEAQGTLVNGIAVMHIRAFVADGYYYQVMVLSKRGTENNREALGFLNSFRLKTP